jgi:hypothetical protein
VRRNLQVLLLLLAGAGMLHISLFTEVYLRYVQPGLRIPLIASGVVLVVLGIIGAARDGFPFSRPEPEHEHHGESEAHGHDHSKGPRVAWLRWRPTGKVGTDAARAALDASDVTRIAEPKDPYG